MKKFLLALACVAGIGSFASAADTYKLVTDASTLKDGDKIVIAAENTGTWYAISTTQNNNNRSATVVTVEDGVLTPSDDTQVITLEEASNGWNLNVGNGYLGNTDTKNNRLKTYESVADGCTVTTMNLSETEKGNGSILFDNASKGILYFNLNTNATTGGPIFNCYGTQSNANYSLPQVFKLVKEETPAQPVYLVGAFNKWTPGDANYQFAEEDGVYTLSLASLDGEFKLSGTNWDWTFGGDAHGQDVKFVDAIIGDNTVWKDSSVNLKVNNLKNVTLTFIYEGNEGILAINEETTIAIVGAFNGWDPTANATTLIKDNCATIVVENYTNGEGDDAGFKILYNDVWYGGATVENGADKWSHLSDAEGAANIDLSAAEGKDVTFTFALDSKDLNVQWSEGSVPGAANEYTIVFEDQEWEMSSAVYSKEEPKVIWKAFVDENKTKWVEFPTSAVSNSTTFPSLYSNGLRVYEASKNNATAHHNVITINAPQGCNFVNVKTTADCRIDGNDVAADTYYVFSTGKNSFEFSAPARPEGNSAAYNVAYTSMTVGLDGKATGVESIASENAPVEYYNLQGVRVANPNAGIYIMRQGNKVSKVLVK